jgi:hypothetical protein
MRRVLAPREHRERGREERHSRSGPEQRSS